ncbi:uncharacterized protein [Ptychodera flava]|uniref:uncharacterized protein n=1 Tax=Ptychodera flava TaxID=63121 RepID=UPI00396A361C
MATHPQKTPAHPPCNLCPVAYNTTKTVGPSKLLDRLQAGIEKIEKILSEWKRALDVTDVMVDKALKHITSISDLQRVIVDAITTNRTLRIGLAGGSISARKFCFGNVLTETIKVALSIPVELHNVAIGATNSRYYAYCFGALLQISQLDIVLWEFAANDYMVGIGPVGQEEFTRIILDLPTRPQLIFVNFLHGEQMKQKSCVNNEKIGSEPLSQYYDVPSISMNDAVCSEVQKPDFEVSDIAISATDGHPNPKNHKVMAYFLCELLKVSLRNLTNSLINTRSLYSGVYSHELPVPLFNDTISFSPHCWTALTTIDNVQGSLKPAAQLAWSLWTPPAISYRRDIKQFWLNENRENFITFNFTVKPYRTFHCTVSIAAFGGPRCGKAKVYLDGDARSEVILDGTWGYNVTLIQQIADNVTPGTHKLTVVAPEGNHFQVGAIVASYRGKNLQSSG